MEDNHAINEQPNAVNEENFNNLLNENKAMKTAIEQLYQRVKQLENTWMLQRAEFLFRVVDNNKFNVDVRQKAQEELENFLFPKQEENKVEEK